MAVLNFAEYRDNGHVTVPGVFTASDMNAAIAEIERWGEEFLADLAPEQRRWYLDGGVKARAVLRKLDNPHFHRNPVRTLARNPEALVTGWIALDEASVENGCMYFGEGTHHRPVMAHVAPPGEPFNLQIPAALAERVAMTPAPVPKGGVFHQSGPNHSPRWRRACALHYVRNDNAFAHPALPFDTTMFLRIS